MLIDGFKKSCKNISDSYLKVENDSTSAINLQATVKENLPHLSYIFHKPEPLGTKFKNVACSVIGSLILILIQRGKYGTKNRNYHLELGTMAACMKIIMEATKGLG